MKTLKLAGACLNTTPLDWGGNLRAAQGAVEEAKALGVSLLCLPELCLTGYGCEDAFFSDDVPTRALNSLEALLPHTRGLVLGVGLPMVHENCVYNCVAMVEDGRVLGFVAKQQLAGAGIHYEPRWFKPWPEHTRGVYRWNSQDFPIGDLIFEVDGIRIGFEICEDAWNGIRPAQRHYQNNVDVILNPSASHFAFGKSLVREGLVREASRSYCCTYVYSNLLGNEAGRVVYDGEVLIAQQGRLLARNHRFSYADWQVLPAVIDIAAPRRGKKKTFAFAPVPPANLVRGAFRFPEPQAADPNCNLGMEAHMPKEEEFRRAAMLGLFDYMRKSRSRGFVLSLSGGADSSACAVLAAGCLTDARAQLGDEAFFRKVAYLNLNPSLPLVGQLLWCVYQATENSGEATETSARALAQALGAVYHKWDIDALVEMYEGHVARSIGRPLTWAHHDVARQNIQARARAPGIWMLANLTGGLLLTTSNRSEAAVGYATMDGDTAGGLGPLGGIDKATLLQWLRWAQAALNIPQLAYVNNLQPSAELRPPDDTQTDEKDVMPYPVLDQIERCAIHEHKSPVEVFRTLRGLEPDAVLHQHIRRFFTLWARNQWKRERYAPSFHLDDANLDPRTWCRFPILSGGYGQELDELDAYVAGLT